MAYPSVDKLQRLLAKEVFGYTKDAKKASGRALGTLIEIITFYLLKAWDLEYHIAIERPLPEFANADISHNVEYSLHPLISLNTCSFLDKDIPLTATKIARLLSVQSKFLNKSDLKSNSLLSRSNIVRNSCTIADNGPHFTNAYLDDFSNKKGHLTTANLKRRPFALFECKRVGVEEGMKKGPQTIEKAKQGAYVAKTVSSLQKIRFSNGKLGGLIESKDGTIRCEEYYSLMAEVIASDNPELLENFILTVGVVSNHGNWFTSDNPNKELKVLAQSYDWLLFLTDAGLAQFIDEMLLNPRKEYTSARTAFLASYTGRKGVNQFTKSKINLDADYALQSFFRSNTKHIESWFNVITPHGKGLDTLKEELDILKAKNWQEIHS